MTIRTPVVVVSGKIASGKTTFAKALSTELSVGCVGFGDEVRAVAESRGQPLIREVLQPIGEELVRNDPRGFCEAVLKRGGYTAGQGLVVEGLRHVEVLTVLRQLLLPYVVTHVHISSPDEIRIERMENRGRVGDVALAAVDSHSTERQLNKELPDVADVIVDGSLSVTAMVAAAVAGVRSQTA